MPDVDALSHAFSETARRHNLLTVEEVIHNLKERHFEADSIRQRMEFGLRQILATATRYESRIVDEHEDIREEFSQGPDLVAIMLTCLGEIQAWTKAALEGCCSNCGRLGGHLRTVNENTTDTLCIECAQR